MLHSQQCLSCITNRGVTVQVPWDLDWGRQGSPPLDDLGNSLVGKEGLGGQDLALWCKNPQTAIIYSNAILYF